MFRITITVFVAFLALGLSVDPQQMEDICGKLDCGSLRCCKTDAVKSSFGAIGMIVKDCMLLPIESCQRASCIGTKLGYGNADGTFDKAKATGMIDKDFNGEAELSSAVKDKCVNGDISVYGLAGVCDVMKFQNCMRIQTLGHCKDWETDSECSSLKDIAAECYKIAP